jgi:hypothetical protein
MPGPYVIDFTDPSKQPITVNPVEVNQSTSLTFVGYRSPVYGEAIWENFLHLMEHFASPTAPDTPVTGQIWVDTTLTPPTPKVWMYDNPTVGVPTSPQTGTWYPIGIGITISTTAPASNLGLWYNPSGPSLNYWNGTGWENILCTVVAKVCEYNDVVNDLNDVMITLGQPLVPTKPELTGGAPTQITDIEWTELLTKIRNLVDYKGVVNPPSSAIDIGSNFKHCSDSPCGLYKVMKQYEVLFDAIDAAANQPPENVNVDCFQTVPASGSGVGVRTTNWTTEIEHQVRFTFTSSSHRDLFFLTGGAILWDAESTYAGGFRGDMWDDFLPQIEQPIYITENITKSGTLTFENGYNDLTTANIVLFQRTTAGLGLYSNSAVVTILGRLDGTNSLILTARFTDPSSGSLSGTLTSSFGFRRVINSATCLTNPPVIPTTTKLNNDFT